ncbi:MAG: hypothetical protein HZA50_04450 [Planctomycetes bacterium]|nr:hypothetical protein [Planctomycetota bacterium]
MGDFGKTCVVSYNQATVDPGAGGNVHAANQGCLPENFFGDGSDGDADIGVATTWAADADYYIVKKFRTFRTIANITATADCKLMLICVQGDCEIAAGSINMDWRGLYGNPSYDTVVFGAVRKIARASGRRFGSAAASRFACPATGASGAPAGGGSGGGGAAAGSAGAGGQTGGGGAGCGYDGQPSGYGGAGGAGSAQVGGSGGGAGGYNGGYTQGGSATGGSGSGGNAGSNGGGNWSSSGGAGNDPGTNSSGGSAVFSNAPGGGGGVLILLVGGTLRIASGARISADGSRGNDETSGYVGDFGGGGAGGGRVIVLARRIVNDGTIRAEGGAGGYIAPNSYRYRDGGPGGAGSVDVVEIG